MVWCLVKHSDNFTFTFTFTFIVERRWKKLLILNVPNIKEIQNKMFISDRDIS